MRVTLLLATSCIECKSAPACGSGLKRLIINFVNFVCSLKHKQGHGLHFTEVYWLFQHRFSFVYVSMLIDKFRGNCEIRGGPTGTNTGIQFIGDRRVWVIYVSCGTNQKVHICQKKKDHSNWPLAEKNSFHGYILFQFILSFHLYDALNVLPFSVMLAVIRCQDVQLQCSKSSIGLPWWKDEGIYPSRSVLTLIVIVHFSAKAYCYGVFQNDGPSRVNSFLTFSSDGIVKCGVMGLEASCFLFFFSFLKETFAWTI